MGRTRAIGLDTTAVTELADKVGQLAGEGFAKVAASALNTVVDRTYELARDRITTGINLSDDYLRKRMSVDHATEANLEASITTAGGRESLTRLVHYGAAMVIVPRKSTRPSRSKGLLGITAGSKQAGVTVSVKTGSTKELSSGFMLTLKQGEASGEKKGVFIRKNGRLKHLYGPSVYQLFGFQADALAEEVADDLQETFMNQVQEHVDRILE